jgi:predicted DNA-binding transcriptional regulator YafY
MCAILPAMLQTPARLLRLLSMLQARRFWSGGELAERLEVTERTLRRDIDRLRTLGYPVHSTSGVAGGYNLGAGASLPPLMLDNEEGLAVFMGLKNAAGGSVKGIENASARALAKLERVLPSTVRRRVQALGSSIVRLADGGPRVELEAVSALAQACSDQLVIHFGYRDKKGMSSRREVEPHRLVHVDRRWYLVAWDRNRADWRTFRIDRLELPIDRTEAFTARSLPDGDAATYVMRSVSTGGYPLRASVILHAPLEEASRSVPVSWGELEARGADRTRLRIAGFSLASLAGWLGMLSLEFEIEEPEELARHVHLVAQRLARAAQRAP